ncbi:MAG: hypothetical protein QXK24_02130 [Ignisphaera sp.]
MTQLVLPDYKFLICGYTTKEHLLVDLDNCSFNKAFSLAKMIMKYYSDVGDCLIVKCAENSYHLVFGNKLSWKRISHIVTVLAELQVLNEDYLKIRKFRKDLTLRVSPKITPLVNKGTPVPVMFIWNDKAPKHDCLIKNYLEVLSAFG